MLVAAEILIVGMAIYAVGHGSASFAAGLHQVDFTGAPIAPIAAGATPHVVIDDAESRVGVTLSNDDQVHVRDLTQIHGAIFSSRKYPALSVTRTVDGVRIERPRVSHLSIDIFDFSTQKIQVAVPAGSRLEIAQCGGADVDGVTGGVSVHSVDGHVTLTDLQGSVDARSDDGYVRATNVHGDRLAMDSKDGHLEIHQVSVGSLSATTDDGRIEANDLSLSGEQPEANLHTGDGSIRLELAPNANFTIAASTGDGRIYVDGSSQGDDDSAQRTIRLGAGAGRMTVGTSDGSIHISTNGVFQ